MKRFKKSGLTVAAFCDREEISASAFNDWKRKLGVKGVEKPSFVELTPSAPPPSASRQDRGEFELSLPGGVVLRWKG
jgi:hypothetical protein